jgi:nicotinamide-nucleotide amidase
MGVATTGNAGPSKGDSQAEIGTVYIAISTEKEIFVEQFLFGIHRERVMEKAVNKALEMIYKQLG